MRTLPSRLASMRERKFTICTRGQPRYLCRGSVASRRFNRFHLVGDRKRPTTFTTNIVIHNRLNQMYVVEIAIHQVSFFSHHFNESSHVAAVGTDQLWCEISSFCQRIRPHCQLAI